jgi:hypothetical protein
MAIERPSCNRVVIVGKNFEVKFFVSPTNNSIIGIALEVSDDLLKDAKNFLNNILLQLNKILFKKSIVDENIKLGIHTTLKIDQINIEDIIQKLFTLSVVLDKTESKNVEGFPIVVIKGNIIGYDLRKYEITIAILASEEIELSIAIETNIYIDKIFNAINYINNLVNIITEAIA